MPSFRLFAPALLALVLWAAPQAAPAQSISDAQRSDIEKIVRDYIISHPEVLEEAMNELSKRQAAAEAEKHQAAIVKNADTIFISPRGVTIGNKDGDVTFVDRFSTSPAVRTCKRMCCPTAASCWGRRSGCEPKRSAVTACSAIAWLWTSDGMVKVGVQQSP